MRKKHCTKEKPWNLLKKTLEQFDSSSEEFGETEAIPDKETFNDKSESSYDESDPLSVVKTLRKLVKFKELNLLKYHWPLGQPKSTSLFL